MTIARTESATADVQGNMVGYREARDQVGIVVKKEWITAGDDLVSEDCAGERRARPDRPGRRVPKRRRRTA
jgi:hypothetical protein